MTLVIKKSALGDVPHLVQILTEAAQHKSALGDDAWATRRFTPELINEWIGEDTMYSVYLADSIVATFILAWEDEVWGTQSPVAGYIHKLAIRDTAHGNGLGRKIIDWAANRTVQNGRKFLRLDFPKQNQGLKKYYEKQGFIWVRDINMKRSGKTYLESLYECPVSKR